MALNIALAEAYVQITARNDQFKRALAEAQRDTERAVSDLQGRFDAVARTGAGLFKPMIAGIFGGAGVIAAVQGATRAFSEYEDALIALSNKLNKPVAQIQDVADALDDLSRRLPIAREQMLAIAEVGVTFGEKTAGGLARFVENVEKFSKATGTAADVAALSLGRIAQAFDIPLEDIDKLGSAINALGDQFPVNMEMMLASIQRFAASAKALNIPLDRVLALSAALSSTGAQAQRLLPSVALLLDDVAVKADKMAAALGMSLEEFNRQLAADPLQFLAEIADDVENNTEAIQLFGDTGIRVLRELAATQGTYSKAVQVVNRELRTGQSLQEDYAKVLASSSAQMTIFGNKLKTVWQEVGRQVAPAFTTALQALNPFLDKLTVMVHSIGPVLSAFGAVGSAMKGVLAAFVGGTENLNMIIATVLKLGAGLAGLAVVIASVSAAFNVLGRAGAFVMANLSLLSGLLQTLLSPMLLIPATALVIYTAWVKNWGGIRDFTEETVKRIGELLAWLSQQADAVNEALKPLASKAGELGKQAVSTVVTGGKLVIEFASSAAQAAFEWLQREWGQLKQQGVRVYFEAKLAEGWQAFQQWLAEVKASPTVQFTFSFVQEEFTEFKAWLHELRTKPVVEVSISFVQAKWQEFRDWLDDLRTNPTITLQVVFQQIGEKVGAVTETIKQRFQLEDVTPQALYDRIRALKAWATTEAVVLKIKWDEEIAPEIRERLDWLRTKTGEAVHTIKTRIEQIGEQMTPQQLSELPEHLKKQLESLGKSINWDEFWKNMKSGAVTGLTKAGHFFDFLANQIGRISDFKDQLTQALQAAILQAREAAKRGAEKFDIATAFMAEAKELNIEEFPAQFVAAFLNLGVSVASFLVEGIRSALSSVSLIATLAAGLAGFVANAVSKFSDSLGPIIQVFDQALADVLSGKAFDQALRERAGKLGETAAGFAQSFVLLGKSLLEAIIAGLKAAGGLTRIFGDLVAISAAGLLGIGAEIAGGIWKGLEGFFTGKKLEDVLPKASSPPATQPLQPLSVPTTFGIKWQFDPSQVVPPEVLEVAAKAAAGVAIAQVVKWLIPGNTVVDTFLPLAFGLHFVFNTVSEQSVTWLFGALSAAALLGVLVPKLAAHLRWSVLAGGKGLLAPVGVVLSLSVLEAIQSSEQSVEKIQKIFAAGLAALTAGVATFVFTPGSGWTAIIVAGVVFEFFMQDVRKIPGKEEIQKQIDAWTKGLEAQVQAQLTLNLETNLFGRLFGTNKALASVENIQDVFASLAERFGVLQRDLRGDDVLRARQLQAIASTFASSVEKMKEGGLTFAEFKSIATMMDAITKEMDRTSQSFKDALEKDEFVGGAIVRGLEKLVAEVGLLLEEFRKQEPIRALQKKQYGGLVPGIGRGDRVPALLEPGEYVIPRWLVEREPGMIAAFDAARQGRAGVPRFHRGGLVKLAAGGPVPVLDTAETAIIAQIAAAMRQMLKDIGDVIKDMGKSIYAFMQEAFPELGVAGENLSKALENLETKLNELAVAPQRSIEQAQKALEDMQKAIEGAGKTAEEQAAQTTTKRIDPFVAFMTGLEGRLGAAFDVPALRQLQAEIRSWAMQMAGQPERLFKLGQGMDAVIGRAGVLKQAFASLGLSVQDFEAFLKETEQAKPVAEGFARSLSDVRESLKAAFGAASFEQVVSRLRGLASEALQSKESLRAWSQLQGEVQSELQSLIADFKAAGAPTTALEAVLQSLASTVADISPAFLASLETIDKAIEQAVQPEQFKGLFDQMTALAGTVGTDIQSLSLLDRSWQALTSRLSDSIDLFKKFGVVTPDVIESLEQLHDWLQQLSTPADPLRELKASLKGIDKLPLDEAASLLRKNIDAYKGNYTALAVLAAAFEKRAQGERERADIHARLGEEDAARRITDALEIFEAQVRSGSLEMIEFGHRLREIVALSPEEAVRAISALIPKVRGHAEMERKLADVQQDVLGVLQDRISVEEALTGSAEGLTRALERARLEVAGRSDPVFQAVGEEILQLDLTKPTRELGAALESLVAQAVTSVRAQGYLAEAIDKVISTAEGRIRDLESLPQVPQIKAQLSDLKQGLSGFKEALYGSVITPLEHVRDALDEAADKISLGAVRRLTAEQGAEGAAQALWTIFKDLSIIAGDDFAALRQVVSALGEFESGLQAAAKFEPALAQTAKAFREVLEPTADELQGFKEKIEQILASPPLEAAPQLRQMAQTLQPTDFRQMELLLRAFNELQGRLQTLADFAKRFKGDFAAFEQDLKKWQDFWGGEPPELKAMLRQRLEEALSGGSDAVRAFATELKTMIGTYREDRAALSTVFATLSSLLSGVEAQAEPLKGKAGVEQMYNKLQEDIRFIRDTFGLFTEPIPALEAFQKSLNEIDIANVAEATQKLSAALSEAQRSGPAFLLAFFNKMKEFSGFWESLSKGVKGGDEQFRAMIAQAKQFTASMSAFFNLGETATIASEKLRALQEQLDVSTLTPQLLDDLANSLMALFRNTAMTADELGVALGLQRKITTGMESLVAAARLQGLDMKALEEQQERLRALFEGPKEALESLLDTLQQFDIEFKTGKKGVQETFVALQGLKESAAQNIQSLLAWRGVAEHVQNTLEALRGTELWTPAFEQTLKTISREWLGQTEDAFAFFKKALTETMDAVLKAPVGQAVAAAAKAFDRLTTMRGLSGQVRERMAVDEQLNKLLKLLQSEDFLRDLPEKMRLSVDMLVESIEQTLSVTHQRPEVILAVQKDIDALFAGLKQASQEAFLPEATRLMELFAQRLRGAGVVEEAMAFGDALRKLRGEVIQAVQTFLTAPALREAGGALVKSLDALLAEAKPEDLLKALEASLATRLQAIFEKQQPLEDFMDEIGFFVQYLRKQVAAAPSAAFAEAYGDALQAATSRLKDYEKTVTENISLSEDQKKAFSAFVKDMLLLVEKPLSVFETLKQSIEAIDLTKLSPANAVDTMQSLLALAPVVRTNIELSDMLSKKIQAVVQKLESLKAGVGLGPEFAAQIQEQLRLVNELLLGGAQDLGRALQAQAEKIAAILTEKLPPREEIARIRVGAAELLEAMRRGIAEGAPLDALNQLTETFTSLQDRLSKTAGLEALPADIRALARAALEEITTVWAKAFGDVQAQIRAMLEPIDLDKLANADLAADAVKRLRDAMTLARENMDVSSLMLVQDQAEQVASKLRGVVEFLGADAGVLKEILAQLEGIVVADQMARFKAQLEEALKLAPLDAAQQLKILAESVGDSVSKMDAWHSALSELTRGIETRIAFFEELGRQDLAEEWRKQLQQVQQVFVPEGPLGALQQALQALDFSNALEAGEQLLDLMQQNIGLAMKDIRAGELLVDSKRKLFDSVQKMIEIYGELGLPTQALKETLTELELMFGGLADAMQPLREELKRLKDVAPLDAILRIRELARAAVEGGPVRTMQSSGIVPGAGRGDTVPALLEPGLQGVAGAATQATEALKRIAEFQEIAADRFLPAAARNWAKGQLAEIQKTLFQPEVDPAEALRILAEEQRKIFESLKQKVQVRQQLGLEVPAEMLQQFKILSIMIEGDLTPAGQELAKQLLGLDLQPGVDAMKTIKELGIAAGLDSEQLGLLAEESQRLFNEQQNLASSLRELGFPSKAREIEAALTDMKLALLEGSGEVSEILRLQFSKLDFTRPSEAVADALQQAISGAFEQGGEAIGVVADAASKLISEAERRVHDLETIGAPPEMIDAAKEMLFAIKSRFVDEATKAMMILQRDLEGIGAEKTISRFIANVGASSAKLLEMLRSQSDNIEGLKAVRESMNAYRQQLEEIVGLLPEYSEAHKAAKQALEDYTLSVAQSTGDALGVLNVALGKLGAQETLSGFLAAIEGDIASLARLREINQDNIVWLKAIQSKYRDMITTFEDVITLLPEGSEARRAAQEQLRHVQQMWLEATGGATEAIDLFREKLSALQIEQFLDPEGFVTGVARLQQYIQEAIASGNIGMLNAVADQKRSLETAFQSLIEDFETLGLSTAELREHFERFSASFSDTTQTALGALRAEIDRLKRAPVGSALFMRQGGIVPGVGRGDRVPAFLEPGELVLPRKASQDVLTLLQGLGISTRAFYEQAITKHHSGFLSGMLEHFTEAGEQFLDTLQGYQKGGVVSEWSKYWLQWYKSLSAKQVSALLNYGIMGYRPINRSLRYLANLPQDIAEKIAQIEAAITLGHLPIDTTVYRGFTSPKLSELLERGGAEALTGKIFSDPAFLSTSLEKGIAGLFPTDLEGLPQFIARIDLPQGTPAAYLTEVIKQKSGGASLGSALEKEVLLQRRSLFVIQDVHIRPNEDVVDLVMKPIKAVGGKAATIFSLVVPTPFDAMVAAREEALAWLVRQGRLPVDFNPMLLGLTDFGALAYDNKVILREGEAMPGAYTSLFDMTLRPWLEMIGLYPTKLEQAIAEQLDKLFWQQIRDLGRSEPAAGIRRTLQNAGGFALGGFTGAGGVSQPAGIVHKGEYVVPAWLTRSRPDLISILESLRKGYAEGGPVFPFDLSRYKPADTEITVPDMGNVVSEAINRATEAALEAGEQFTDMLQGKEALFTTRVKTSEAVALPARDLLAVSQAQLDIMNKVLAVLEEMKERQAGIGARTKDQAEKAVKPPEEKKNVLADIIQRAKERSAEIASKGAALVKDPAALIDALVKEFAAEAQRIPDLIQKALAEGGPEALGAIRELLTLFEQQQKEWLDTLNMLGISTEEFALKLKKINAGLMIEGSKKRLAELQIQLEEMISGFKPEDTLARGPQVIDALKQFAIDTFGDPEMRKVVIDAIHDFGTLIRDQIDSFRAIMGVMPDQEAAKRQLRALGQFLADFEDTFQGASKTLAERIRAKLDTLLDFDVLSPAEAMKVIQEQFSELMKGFGDRDLFQLGPAIAEIAHAKDALLARLEETASSLEELGFNADDVRKQMLQIEGRFAALPPEVLAIIDSLDFTKPAAAAQELLRAFLAVPRENKIAQDFIVKAREQMLQSLEREISRRRALGLSVYFLEKDLERAQAGFAALSPAMQRFVDTLSSSMDSMVNQLFGPLAPVIHDLLFNTIGGAMMNLLQDLTLPTNKLGLDPIEGAGIKIAEASAKVTEGFTLVSDSSVNAARAVTSILASGEMFSEALREQATRLQARIDEETTRSLSQSFKDVNKTAQDLHKTMVTKDIPALDSNAEAVQDNEAALAKATPRLGLFGQVMQLITKNIQGVADTLSMFGIELSSLTSAFFGLIMQSKTFKALQEELAPIIQALADTLGYLLEPLVEIAHFFRELLGISKDMADSFSMASANVPSGFKFERMRYAAAIPDQPALGRGAGATRTGGLLKPLVDFFRSLEQIPVVGYLIKLALWAGRLALSFIILDKLIRAIPLIGTIYDELMKVIARPIAGWVWENALKPGWEWFVRYAADAFIGASEQLFTVLQIGASMAWERIASAFQGTLTQVLSNIGQLTIAAGVVYLAGQIGDWMERTGAEIAEQGKARNDRIQLATGRGIQSAGTGLKWGSLLGAGIGFLFGGPVGAIVGAGIGAAGGAALGANIGLVGGTLEHMQHGGYILQPGLAAVHAGEMVLPAAQVRSLGEMEALAQPVTDINLEWPRDYSASAPTSGRDIIVIDKLVIDDPDLNRRLREYIRNHNLRTKGIAVSHTLLD